jgi:hypothetical protein
MFGMKTEILQRDLLHLFFKEVIASHAYSTRAFANNIAHVGQASITEGRMEDVL